MENRGKEEQGDDYTGDLSQFLPSDVLDPMKMSSSEKTETQTETASDSNNYNFDMVAPICCAIRSSRTNEVFFFFKYELEYVRVYYIPGDTGDNKILTGQAWIGDWLPSLLNPTSLADTRRFTTYGINCAFDTEDSEVYIFTEDYCAHIDYANDKILSGPVKIGEMFPVLKNTVFEDGIDSAFRSIKDKEVYLFKDNKYCCIAYDCREQLIGSIGNIGDGFPVLKGTIFESGIDACFASHEKGGVYFFKDEKYVHIKFTSDSYDDVIPGNVNVRYVLDGWPCLEGLFCIDGELVFDKIIVRQ